MGIKVTHSLHIIGNKRFPKDLFCDAWLTKDGVTLIPVHRVILAGVSDKFKKLFQREEGGGRVHVVPLLDFDILKRVVNFIYDGQIVLKSEEEHGDFMDALATLKVEVGDTVTRDRRSSRSSKAEEKDKESRNQTHTVGVERRKLRSGKELGVKVKETKLNVGEKVREKKLKGGDKVKEAKLNAKLMKLSREDAREERSFSTDSRNLKLEEKRSRKSFEKQGEGQEKSTREDFIANAKSQLCMFFAKGYCMRGTTCWFKHEKVADDIEEKSHIEEKKPRSREPRHMLLRLVDYTVTVKTLDLEEYFSQFGEVLEVKFTGLSQEGWSNFNLEVRWADTLGLQALQKQSHFIKGTDVMVEQCRSRSPVSRTLKRSRSRSPVSRRTSKRSRSRSPAPRRTSKRSRSRSPVSRTMRSYSREGGSPVVREPENRWRGSSQFIRMEEKDTVMRKEIKVENLQGEICPEGLVQETASENILGEKEVARDQVKIKKEVGEVARASDAVPEELKESNHLARLLKEDQENGASPKKVILVMVLVFEEKEKAVKLLVNPRKQVEKAMQEMAKHLKKDPASLLFSLENEGRRLTGKEIMGDLEGARIVITRLY